MSKKQPTSRRRFLALCGGTVAGIWLAGTGFVQLERRMLLKITGSCSFCGKRAEDVFGLAGLSQRDATICDECAELCLYIIGEELAADAKRNPSRAAAWTAPDDLETLLENARRESEIAKELESKQDAIREELERTLARGVRPRVLNLSCSFCDRSQRDVDKLISGPNEYICDKCVGDVAGVLLGRRLRAG